MEWKFDRTTYNMKFINGVGAIPPPLNLIPIRQIIAFFLNRKRNFQRKHKKSMEKWRDFNKYEVTITRIVLIVVHNFILNFSLNRC